jgi:hypothetical protein
MAAHRQHAKGVPAQGLAPLRLKVAPFPSEGFSAGIRRALLLVLLLPAACHIGPSPCDSLLTVVASSEHVDLTTSVAHPEEVLRLAEETYELLEELLEVHPGRVKIAVLSPKEDFQKYIPSLPWDTLAFYLADPDPLIVIHHPVRRPLLQHEMAHHFLAQILDDESEWLNEGAAVVLQGAIRVQGHPHLPLVDPELLDQLLARDPSDVSMLPRERASGRSVSYAEAWAGVAFILMRESGAWRERFRALNRPETAPREKRRPSQEQLLRDLAPWKRELADQLASSAEPKVRAASARLLGLLGDRETLSRAWTRNDELLVRASVAGALARLGDRKPLLQLLPLIASKYCLDQVSRSLQLEFESVSELRAWAYRPR